MLKYRREAVIAGMHKISWVSIRMEQKSSLSQSTKESAIQINIEITMV